MIGQLTEPVPAMPMSGPPALPPSALTPPLAPPAVAALVPPLEPALEPAVPPWLVVPPESSAPAELPAASIPAVAPAPRVTSELPPQFNCTNASNDSSELVNNSRERFLID
jgi:hypothetical protein